MVPANGDFRGCRINKGPTGCRTAGRQSIRILDRVSVSFLHFERFGNINICRTLRPERKFSGQTLLPLSMSSLAFRPSFVRMIACGRSHSQDLRPLKAFSLWAVEHDHIGALTSSSSDAVRACHGPWDGPEGWPAHDPSLRTQRTPAAGDSFNRAAAAPGPSLR